MNFIIPHQWEFRLLVKIEYTFLLFILLLLSSIVGQGQSHGIKNGVNIQASYYNNGNVNIGWDLMKQYPAIEAVRIEIEPDKTEQAVRWIREAQQNGYQVIATYHKSSQLGSNNTKHLQTAADWWVRHYARFTTHGPIHINIMNEWGGHELSPKDYAAAYNKTIATVRTVHNGLLIIDLPGFGHDIEIAASAYPLIEDQQVIYSIHIYPNAVNVQDNRWINVKDLDYLIEAGVPCMIGEFGARGFGGTNWCEIVEYAHDKGWAIFGWAWNGDGRGMNMASPSWAAQPRATSFEPTPYLEEIVASLIGVPCNTQQFEDSLMPCTIELIGTSCDDQNDFTINDRYNEYCVCAGIFTDVLEASTDPQIFLYPNPVQQLLRVELLRTNRIQQFEIYNSIGQRIKIIPISDQRKTFSIDVSTYPRGTYIITTIINGKFVAEKFAKI